MCERDNDGNGLTTFKFLQRLVMKHRRRTRHGVMRLVVVHVVVVAQHGAAQPSDSGRRRVVQMGAAVQTVVVVSRGRGHAGHEVLQTQPGVRQWFQSLHHLVKCNCYTLQCKSLLTRTTTLQQCFLYIAYLLFTITALQYFIESTKFTQSTEPITNSDNAKRRVS